MYFFATMTENLIILFHNSCALCSRHSYVLLRPRQAFWGRLRTGLNGDRGVSPRRGQVQLSIHHLQESAVCLPAAAQVWQPEDLHQGKPEVMPVSPSARVEFLSLTLKPHWRLCSTLCMDWLEWCVLNDRRETLQSASSSEIQTMKAPPLWRWAVWSAVWGVKRNWTCCVCSSAWCDVVLVCFRILRKSVRLGSNWQMWGSEHTQFV